MTRELKQAADKALWLKQTSDGTYEWKTEINDDHIKAIDKLAENAIAFDLLRLYLDDMLHTEESGFDKQTSLFVEEETLLFIRGKLDELTVQARMEVDAIYQKNRQIELETLSGLFKLGM